MPRRIIYISNPSEGSNFRTIDVGGGGSSKPPKSKKPKAPPLTSGWTLTSWGAWRSPSGAIYANNAWSPTNRPRNNFNQTPYAQTPYSQDYLDSFGLLDFEPASTLLGQLYDVWIRGMDPYRGDIMMPAGTPGTLKSPLMIELANMSHGNLSAFYGGVGPTDILNRFLHPDRFEPRPWWAQ